MINNSPSIARTKPGATASPRPDAAPTPIAETLERLEHLFTRAAEIPGRGR